MLPPARDVIADRGYDSDRFRDALEDRDIQPCIHPLPLAPHGHALYRYRHRIENLFARLKDWRRVATRYDQCADLFIAAIVIAATVILWLRM